MIKPEALPPPYDRHLGRCGPRLAAELISATALLDGSARWTSDAVSAL